MERLGLAGMFTCLPPVRSGAVQVPEYTAHRTRQQSDTPIPRWFGHEARTMEGCARLNEADPYVNSGGGQVTAQPALTWERPAGRLRLCRSINPTRMSSLDQPQAAQVPLQMDP